MLVGKKSSCECRALVRVRPAFVGLYCKSSGARPRPSTARGRIERDVRLRGCRLGQASSWDRSIGRWAICWWNLADLPRSSWKTRDSRAVCLSARRVRLFSCPIGRFQPTIDSSWESFSSDRVSNRLFLHRCRRWTFASDRSAQYYHKKSSIIWTQTIIYITWRTYFIMWLITIGSGGTQWTCNLFGMSEKRIRSHSNICCKYLSKLINSFSWLSCNLCDLMYCHRACIIAGLVAVWMPSSFDSLMSNLNCGGYHKNNHNLILETFLHFF